MECLLHELIRLPLSERLYIIEQAINSMDNGDPEARLRIILQELHVGINQIQKQRA